MTAWGRRVLLAVLRRLRRWIEPPLPPGSVRHFAGDADGSGVYWRGLTEAERDEMRQTDPRPRRAPRRWADRGPRTRY